MASIDTIIKHSRTAMLENQHDSTNAEFVRRFGLSPGDFISYHPNDASARVVRARILHCESCYYNRRGGYTAIVSVLPLLVGGRIGNSRRVYLIANANGGCVKQLFNDRPVEKLS